MKAELEGEAPLPARREKRANFDSIDQIRDVVPRLLVSVRSMDEAERAILGGAEILDVKEPLRGSLGMSTIAEINSIAAMQPIQEGSIPMSVALGELFEWNQSQLIPALPSGISFAKMGLSRCATNSNWREEWLRARDEFERSSASVLDWVAVVYADNEAASSPPPFEVVDAAIESGCRGLLIDTWEKGERTLVDLVDRSLMIEIADKCHKAGLFFALAGKIGRGALSELAEVPADIIAIRSAACRTMDRTCELVSEQVNEFRKAINREFQEN